MSDPETDADDSEQANRTPSENAESTGSTGSAKRTEATSELPVIEPADLASRSRDRERPREGSIVGVVLAAGTSSRYGAANKLLATVNGEAIVRRAVMTVLDAAVDRVIVVLGHEAGRVRGALDGLDVDVVRNDDYERGQATSVRTGVGVADERGASAVVIALGDMPAVDASTVDTLIEAYRADAGDALAAAYGGRRGNPVCFDARYFEALCDVSGDTGGRSILLESERAALVETGDPGVVRDVDTRADLEDVE